MPERTRTVAQLLGYPDDAHLLIINADDFGMCHAENAATIAGLELGAFCSATVMVPCPWFPEAVLFAQRAPEADLGVHITHTSEWLSYKWGPVCGAGAVPSLVDAHGHFFRDAESLYAHARLDEIERETRAQIERALAAGIDVTHLDSHMGTVQLDANYHDLYVRLAAEYRLPIRMARRSWMRHMGMTQIVELADQLGVLSPDHFWFGGPPRPEDTAAYWTDLLHNLTPGVNELYVHAAFDEPEMRAIGDAWAQRVADYEFFTAPSTHALLRELEITLIGYRALRTLQRQLRAC
ncbi:MAG TPA: polysaccharide deacetylase family protein [Candidatus Margulisiibacteriota bacterium]|nr:polysaccharide deacetylase family protein [Candidatus Margulisiibacteriota bacterium]